MEQHKRTNWITSFDELRVLLSALGSDSCEGVFMPEKSFTKEQVIACIGALTRKNWITVTGDDHFVIREDLLKVLRIIQNPRSTDIIRTAEGEYFLYITEGSVVVSAVNHQKKESLKLTLMGFDEFLSWKEDIEA